MKITDFIKKRKIEILIAVLFILLRVPDLGYDVFNTDVWKWKSRIYDFGSGVFNLDFERTIQKYHPGVTLMWIGAISVKAFNAYHEIFLGSPPPDNNIAVVFALHATQKFFIVSVLAVLMAFIYYPLSKLFKKEYALLAVLLLSTEPFYVALTRVIHLEGLMSTFMIASFVWLYYYLHHKKSRFLILSAAFSSLAVLTKTSSLFMLPFTFLVLMIDSYRKEKGFKHFLITFQSRFLTWFLFAVLIFVVLWPAMHTHSGLALQVLYRGIFTIGIERDHPQLFLGKWVEDPGIYFYPVVFFVKSSLFLILGFVGLFYNMFKVTRGDEKRWFVIYSFLFFIFYLVELSFPSKKLDRYILPSLMAGILMVSFYYEYLFDWLQKKLKISYYWFFSLFAAISIGTMVYLHPNYFSYYSPLTGGLELGIRTLEPKWMLGQREIVDFFAEEMKKGEFSTFPEGESIDDYINKSEVEDMFTVAFQEKYYTQIWPFIEKMGGRATVKDISRHATRTNYLVYPVYDDDSEKEDRFKMEYVGTIKLRNVDLYNVYKRIKPIVY